MRHPIQPVAPDSHGRPRFKQNAIVRYLLDAGPFDMNDLAMKRFSDEDLEQFAQLIGYSLDGFGSLSYVSDETYHAAKRMAEGRDEKDALIEMYGASLAEIRRGLKIAATEAFRVHPDELVPGGSEAES